MVCAVDLCSTLCLLEFRDLMQFTTEGTLTFTIRWCGMGWRRFVVRFLLLCLCCLWCIYCRVSDEGHDLGCLMQGMVVVMVIQVAMVCKWNVFTKISYHIDHIEQREIWHGWHTLCDTKRMIKKSKNIWSSLKLENILNIQNKWTKQPKNNKSNVPVNRKCTWINSQNTNKMVVNKTRPYPKLFVIKTLTHKPLLI